MTATSTKGICSNHTAATELLAEGGSIGAWLTSEGAAILFVNPRGEVLLRLRSDKPGLLFANHWDSIGGAVEPGESPEEAAIRETHEEIGLELQGHIYWDEYQSLVLVRIYAAPLDLPAEEIDLTEGQRVEWFDLEAALKLPLHPWVASDTARVHAVGCLQPGEGCGEHGVTKP